jgi:hypothetical protein
VVAMPPERAEGRPEDNFETAVRMTSRFHTADDTSSLGQPAAENEAVRSTSPWSLTGSVAEVSGSAALCGTSGGEST